MGVHRIAKANVDTGYAGAAWLPNVLPRSMAASATSLYYVGGSGLERVSTTAMAPAPQRLATIAADSDRLQVDEACVYWVEASGARMMKGAK